MGILWKMFGKGKIGKTVMEALKKKVSTEEVTIDPSDSMGQSTSESVNWRLFTRKNCSRLNEGCYLLIMDYESLQFRYWRPCICKKYFLPRNSFSSFWYYWLCWWGGNTRFYVEIFRTSHLLSESINCFHLIPGNTEEEKCSTLYLKCIEWLKIVLWR